MNTYMIRKSLIVICLFCLLAIAVRNQAETPIENQANNTTLQAEYEKGLVHYENNDIDKALAAFKNALASTFPEPAEGKLPQAVELAQSGRVDEAEKILLSLVEDEETAARARYELGLIYEAQGKLDKAASMFNNALTIISNRGAKYVGVKGCTKCHFKQRKSWEKTKMAKAFDVLKPGVKAEAKAKLKFDPQKDYTRDAKCLECHTTGFGLPGGYKIPEPGDSKSARRAKENSGVTCEGCHGPGSKYIAVHKNVMGEKRQYTPEEFYQAGEYKVELRVCTTCHNRRNPTVGSDYHFDYEKYKAEDTHENVPLKYRSK